jgi:hypothetical protein
MCTFSSTFYLTYLQGEENVNSGVPACMQNVHVVPIVYTLAEGPNMVTVIIVTTSKIRLLQET